MSEIRIVSRDALVENRADARDGAREAVSSDARIIAVRTQAGLVSGWHHHEDQVIVGFRVGSGVTVVNVEGPASGGLTPDA
jgi:hypothetical protein